MRVIQARTVSKVISELAVKANIALRQDVLRVLKSSLVDESKAISRNGLEAIILNAKLAKKTSLAICQDTGFPVVFADIGEQVFVRGNIYEAIQKGIKDGYKRAHLRESVILDPLRRKVKYSYGPALINFKVIKGKRVILTVLPKGFGSENKSAVMMFKPTTDIKQIIAWVLDMVELAGADACPPYILGIGIGGTSDEAGRLAKHALLRPIDKRNKDRFLADLESKILREVNNTGIGPFGLGGKTTALGVNIETAPTHIAGLPVAINISCHALRSATAII